MILKNQKNRILGITFLFFSILFLSSLIFAVAPATEPCWVKGTATGDGVTVSGLTVEAYLGSTLLKSGTIASDGTYSLNSVGADTNDSILLKVYGASFNTFDFNGYCTTGNDPWIVQNFTVSKQANGVSCSNNAICTSGNCSSNVCAAVSTGGGTTGGTTSGSGTTTPPTTEITTQNYSWVPPTPSTPSQVREILQGSSLTEVEMERYMSEADRGYMFVERELSVKKTVSSTGEESYSSTFIIKVSNYADNPLNEIRLVEVIPKEIALDASQISSQYSFRVLLADPIVEFIIPTLDVGEVISIPYVINTNVTEEEFLSMGNTLSLADVGEVQPPIDIVTPPVDNSVNGDINNSVNGDINNPVTPGPDTSNNNTWVWIIIVLLILGLVIYYVVKGKKPNKKLGR